MDKEVYYIQVVSNLGIVNYVHRHFFGGEFYYGLTPHVEDKSTTMLEEEIREWGQEVLDRDGSKLEEWGFEPDVVYIVKETTSITLMKKDDRS